MINYINVTKMTKTTRRRGFVSLFLASETIFLQNFQCVFKIIEPLFPFSSSMWFMKKKKRNDINACNWESSSHDLITISQYPFDRNREIKIASTDSLRWSEKVSRLAIVWHIPVATNCSTSCMHSTLLFHFVFYSIWWNLCNVAFMSIAHK